MRRKTIYIVAVFVMAAATIFVFMKPSSGEQARPARGFSESAPIEIRMNERSTISCDLDCVALRVYTLDAMQSWMPKVVAGSVSHLEDIASDIAFVSLHEPRIWKGSNGSREALLLASIAWWETLYRDYVDDGRCNAWARQCMTFGPRGPYCDFSKLSVGEPRNMMRIGTCDGGRSAGVWQVHCGDGVTRGTDPRACEGVAGRKLAAASALAMARQSIQAGAGLENYVGGFDSERRARKAKERLDKADGYWRAHPFAIEESPDGN